MDENEKIEVSAKDTGGCYRITHNGRVLGDSRGFDKAQANAKIDEEVATLRGYRYPFDAHAKHV